MSTAIFIPSETPERAALSASLSQVYALRGLPTGWNGHNALPPAAESVRHARLWLEAQWQQCRENNIPWYAPNVTTSAEGEVVFEWWAEDRSLIVYVEDNTAEFHCSQDGDGPTQHTHGEAPLGQAQADLMRWFGERWRGKCIPSQASPTSSLIPSATTRTCRTTQPTR